MIIDLNHVFKNLDGSEIVGPPKKEGEKGVAFTLKTACENALMMPAPGEKDLEVEEKLRRGDLAQRIYREKGNVDLSAEEVVLLKDLVGRSGAPLIVSQAFEVLDPKDPPPRKERSNIPSNKNK